MAPPDPARQGVPVKHLFTEGRAVPTVLLWVPFFMVFMVLVTVTFWTPAVLNSVGFSLSAAALIIGLNNLGSVIASATSGWAVHRGGAFRVLIPGFILGGLSASPGSAKRRRRCSTLGAASFLAGFFVGGTGTGLIAVAAGMYPTAIRSTGIGWAMGMGRVGQVFGPILTGVLVGLGYKVGGIFYAAAVPCLIGALFLMLPVFRPSGHGGRCRRNRGASGMRDVTVRCAAAKANVAAKPMRPKICAGDLEITGMAPVRSLNLSDGRSIVVEPTPGDRMTVSPLDYFDAGFPGATQTVRIASLDDAKVFARRWVIRDKDPALKALLQAHRTRQQFRHRRHRDPPVAASAGTARDCWSRPIRRAAMPHAAAPSSVRSSRKLISRRAASSHSTRRTHAKLCTEREPADVRPDPDAGAAPAAIDRTECGCTDDGRGARRYWR